MQGLQFIDPLRRQDVAAAGQYLPALDKGRPQRFQGHAHPLRGTGRQRLAGFGIDVNQQTAQAQSQQHVLSAETHQGGDNLMKPAVVFQSRPRGFKHGYASLFM